MGLLYIFFMCQMATNGKKEVKIKNVKIIKNYVFMTESNKDKFKYVETH